MDGEWDGSGTTHTSGELAEPGDRRGEPLHREDSFAKNDDVHVQRFEVGWTIRVLIETAETDKIVCPEEFNLLARFFHLDIFRCQWVDAENLFANDWLDDSTQE